MSTSMGFVDVVVKICCTFLIIFYDVGPFRRNMSGTRWMHLVREMGVFIYRLFLRSVQWLVQIS